MALKRLDEQFPFSSKQPVGEQFRQALRAIEARFSGLEAQRADFDAAVTDFTTIALDRVNDILLPAAEKIIRITDLGFLRVHSGSSVALIAGQDKTFVIPEGDERDLFQPSTFVTIQRTTPGTENNYSIAQVLSWDKSNGFLTLRLLSVSGSAGPFTDWEIVDSPGVAVATRNWLLSAIDYAAAAQLAATQAQAASDAVGASDFNPAYFAPLDSPHFVNVPTVPTATGGVTGQIANVAFVNAAITNLIGGAPAALDTLNEIAASLGNNASIAATLTNSIATRLRFDAAQSLTSAGEVQALANLNFERFFARHDAPQTISAANRDQLRNNIRALTGPWENLKYFSNVNVYATPADRGVTFIWSWSSNVGFVLPVFSSVPLGFYFYLYAGDTPTGLYHQLITNVTGSTPILFNGDDQFDGTSRFFPFPGRGTMVRISTTSDGWVIAPVQNPIQSNWIMSSNGANVGNPNDSVWRPVTYGSPGYTPANLARYGMGFTTPYTGIYRISTFFYGSPQNGAIFSKLDDGTQSKSGFYGYARYFATGGSISVGLYENIEWTGRLKWGQIVAPFVLTTGEAGFNHMNCQFFAEYMGLL